MRKDLLNDLYKDEQMLRYLGNILQDMHISGLLAEAPWYVFPNVKNDDGSMLPLTERLSLTANNLQNKMRVLGDASINTYPFGRSTTQVFPEFLGICSGGTKFYRVLNAVRGYCEKARKKLPEDQPKTVMVFTDKWDWTQFQRGFEFPFLRYALENNILFIFLLVTDYGVSHIPFLARSRAELEDLRRRRYVIEDDPGSVCSNGCRQDTLGDSAVTISAGRGRNGMLPVDPDADGRAYDSDDYQDRFDHYLEHLKQYDPFVLERRSALREPFSGLASGEIRYEFILRQRCCVVREGTQTPQMKRIPPNDMKEFARALMQWEDVLHHSHEFLPVSLAPDSVYCAAELHGDRLIWDPAALDAMPQPVKEIAAALEKLVASLKEMR